MARMSRTAELQQTPAGGGIRRFPACDTNTTVKPVPAESLRVRGDDGRAVSLAMLTVLKSSMDEPVLNGDDVLGRQNELPSVGVWIIDMGDGWNAMKNLCCVLEDDTELADCENSTRRAHQGGRQFSLILSGSGNEP